MTRTSLATLRHADLDRYAAWAVTGDVVDGAEILEPVTTFVNGKLPSHLGEVWCRSQCRFSDGSLHRACALYRGDSSDGPLAWSVFNGSVDVPLVLPPAPAEVLAVDGPERLASSFGRAIADVFPLEIAAACLFQTPPETRSVIIDASGVVERRTSSGLA